jgi:hypothetical protein
MVVEPDEGVAMAGSTTEAITQFSETDLQKLPPGLLLEHIQKLFKNWGIYNQKLTLRHEGDDFVFSCHDEAFVVYRLLPAAGPPSGAPGWPVCLVTADGLIDECSPPYHNEDFFASHLSLADWLAIIQQYYGEP